MGRKRPGSSARIAATLAMWTAAASLSQGLFGADFGRAGRALEQQLERKTSPPSLDPQPQRSHESESYEPWELVKV